MIADIQNALKTLIYEEAGLPQDAIDVRFAAPTSNWVAGLTRPTLNFFLHDLHENAGLRSMEFQRADSVRGAKRTLAPRRVDLKYLVNVFFKSQVDELGRDEWNVLWRVLAALMRQEEWEAKYVPSAVKELDLNVLGIVNTTPNQTNYSLFTSLALSVRPHLNYTLTVPLDLNISSFAPFVFERRVGLRAGLELEDDTEADVLVIRSSWLIRDENGQPIRDALVRTDSGERGFTDASGVVHLPVERESVRQLDVLTLDGKVMQVDPAQSFLSLESGR